MTGKTKKQAPENDSEEPKDRDESAWSKDQREKSYYYDDSFGYSIYETEDDEEEETE